MPRAPVVLAPMYPRVGRRARAGVSLLEVLISIGVISIGLLGVLATFPVARFEIVQTAKLDRSAALGQAGLREIRLRETYIPLAGTAFPELAGTRHPMLSPYSWRNLNGLEVVVPDLSTGQLGIPFGRSFAIDPLFMARNAADPAIDVFPYRAGGLPNLPLARVSLAPAAGTVNAALQETLFSRIFISRDPVDYPLPEEATERPRQIFLTDGPQGAAPFPQLPGEPPPGNPLVPQVLANYTWMATVTPTANLWHFLYDSDGDGAGDLPCQYIGREPLYSVSIVVFFQRDFTSPDDTLPPTPGERAVQLNFLGFGPGGALGGGDAILAVPDTDPVELLEVKENEWLMVSGRRMVQAGAMTFPLNVHKWYRILAAGEMPTAPNAGRWERYVTLDGPDWPALDMNGDGAFDLSDTFEAVLTTGVIGVYTTTIELDEP